MLARFLFLIIFLLVGQKVEWIIRAHAQQLIVLSQPQLKK